MAYIAKIERSGAKIVDSSTGATKRVISGTYTQALVQGNEAHCTQPNGKIKIVNISTGATIRVI